MTWWDDLVRTPSPFFKPYYLDDARTAGPPKKRTLAPGESYIRVRLRSIHIPFVRKGFSRFYGVLHSSIEVPHLDGRATMFEVVTSPADLRNVAAARPDRIIHHDRTLCGWCPYVGGTLRLRLALISVKAGDLAGPYVSLLEEVAGLAGVAYAATAAPYVAAVRKGVDLLTGSASDSDVEVALVADLSPCETGWWFIARIEQHAAQNKILGVDRDGQVHNANGAPVKDAPYFVFTIEAESTRDDWFEIPEIKASYSRLRTLTREGVYPEAEKELAHLLRIIKLSPDLLAADRATLADKIEKEFRSATPATLTSGKEARGDVMRELVDLGLYS